MIKLWENSKDIQHAILTVTEKAQHPAGIKHTTSGLPGVISTAELQPTVLSKYLPMSAAQVDIKRSRVKYLLGLGWN